MFVYICLVETAQFILERVAPIFNRQGYVGTSLSDLTRATSLTKGAVYFHFKNKEELALKAFYYNVKLAIKPLADQLSSCTSATEKLRTIIHYYRGYRDTVEAHGGCPVLNVGVDARFNNPLLFNAVRKVSSNLVQDLVNIIDEGKASGEFQPDADSQEYAKYIYSTIQGSLFMAFTHDDESYVREALDGLTQTIEMKILN